MKEELLRLADLCEAAQGPDRELDAAIGSTIYQMKVGHEVPGIEGCRHELFTASLDAAMSLVPDNIGIELERFWIGGTWAERWECVLENETDLYLRAGAVSGPLALCAASLKARAGPAASETPNLSPQGHSHE